MIRQLIAHGILASLCTASQLPDKSTTEPQSQQQDVSYSEQYSEHVRIRSATAANSGTNQTVTVLRSERGCLSQPIG